MNIYEQANDLYNYSDLEGCPVYLEYVPTQRSRKWRSSSFYIKSFNSALHGDLDIKLKNQEGWFNARFVKASC